MSILDDNNPPGIYTLHLNGIKADENGMYKAKDVLDRFNSAIEAYDLMIEEYKEDAA